MAFAVFIRAADTSPAKANTTRLAADSRDKDKREHMSAPSKAADLYGCTYTLSIRPQR